MPKGAAEALVDNRQDEACLLLTVDAVLRDPVRYNKNSIVRKESCRTLSEDETTTSRRTKIDPPAAAAPPGHALLLPRANATVRPPLEEATEEETPVATATTAITRGGSTEKIQQRNQHTNS